jgi:uncharacterized coiled-coil protein SlyX
VVTERVERPKIGWSDYYDTKEVNAYMDFLEAELRDQQERFLRADSDACAALQSETDRLEAALAAANERLAKIESGIKNVLGQSAKPDTYMSLDWLIERMRESLKKALED